MSGLVQTRLRQGFHYDDLLSHMEAIQSVIAHVVEIHDIEYEEPIILVTFIYHFSFTFFCFCFVCFFFFFFFFLCVCVLCCWLLLFFCCFCVWGWGGGGEGLRFGMKI